jgi:hypothetical protein
LRASAAFFRASASGRQPLQPGSDSKIRPLNSQIMARSDRARGVLDPGRGGGSYCVRRSLTFLAPPLQEKFRVSQYTATRMIDYIFRRADAGGNWADAERAVARMKFHNLTL